MLRGNHSRYYTDAVARCREGNVGWALDELEETAPISFLGTWWRGLGLADRAEVVLVRHGETEWSRTGRHTGNTDVPLTDRGRMQARLLGDMLRDRPFARVLTSPLRRAYETCRLAGLGDAAEECSHLREWDYGVYEGRTTADIRKEIPDWTVWSHPVPGGETADLVARRADYVIDLAREADEDVALFAHGHILRVLAARWCGLDAAFGRLFSLDTTTLSVLGYERETPVIRLWNQKRDL